MAFFLSDRQETLYGHLCDLFQPTQEVDVETRLASLPEYTPAASGVPCHFERRQSIESPRALGRAETDIQGTRDQINLPETVNINSGWAIVNRTLDFDGNPAVEYGFCYIVQGRPQTIPRVGNRDAGKQTVEIVFVPQAPPGVTV